MAKETGKDAGELLTLQKALALACRVLADNIGCPMEVIGNIKCSRNRKYCEAPECSMCWKEQLLTCARAEQICFHCGCTQFNACPDFCSWVDANRCSLCAARQSEAVNGR